LPAEHLGPRAQQVAATIRFRILAGQWTPGMCLPSHPQLAKEFGVARMTVYHALTTLAREGLIVLERGRGTFVAGLPARRVLVVDAGRGQRSLLRAYINSLGYPAQEAAGPAEALHCLEQDRSIGMVMTDTRLPAADDGLRLIRTVKQRWPGVPLVAVTAFSEDLTPLHGTPAWPDLVITRPFQVASIAEALRLSVPPSPPAPAVAPERRPVLLVDDDPGIRAVLRDWIKLFGFESHEASTGGRALLAFQQRDFGHVFLDLHLPGGGVPFAAALAEAYSSTTVIIVTAFPEDVLGAGGPFTLLTKPFDGEGVRAALQLQRQPLSPEMTVFSESSI
jgi:CheY-like chemotaxis protein